MRKLGFMRKTDDCKPGIPLGSADATVAASDQVSHPDGLGVSEVLLGATEQREGSGRRTASESPRLFCFLSHHCPICSLPQPPSLHHTPHSGEVPKNYRAEGITCDLKERRIERDKERRSKYEGGFEGHVSISSSLPSSQW
ncbi:unnamed protein product [Linum trigynum]|uniref:Uncharacterized protein n=1 Tax=Linum trigynum TaxID=586398 RepID=A0AAV2GA93_9ROSI